VLTASNRGGASGQRAVRQKTAPNKPARLGKETESNSSTPGASTPSYSSPEDFALVADADAAAHATNAPSITHSLANREGVHETTPSKLAPVHPRYAYTHIACTHTCMRVHTQISLSPLPSSSRSPPPSPSPSPPPSRSRSPSPTLSQINAAQHQDTEGRQEAQTLPQRLRILKSPL
jgi:hypothetical protein